MKTSFKAIDQIFEFKGLWDMPSKCGLKILKQKDKFIVIVTELYQDNPGTSITQAVCGLAKQICTTFKLPKEKIVYIERNPEMNSKLSFYNEEYYLVEFDFEADNFVNPRWKKINSNPFHEKQS